MTNEFLRNAFVILVFVEGERSKVEERRRTGFGRSELFLSGLRPAVYIVFSLSSSFDKSVCWLAAATRAGEAAKRKIPSFGRRIGENYVGMWGHQITMSKRFLMTPSER
jgi:hypothetical protein